MLRHDQLVADDLTEAAALIWEQAQRQLAQQGADLDTLRTRAVAMLSVAALVAGLFGSRLPHGHASARTVIAVIAALVLFGVSVVLAVLIGMPKNWLFTFKLDELMNRVEAGTATSGDVNISLAARAEENRRENAGQLEFLYSLFGVACVLVGLQVAAWAIAVI
jgi:hypothetical protein